MDEARRRSVNSRADAQASPTRDEALPGEREFIAGCNGIRRHRTLESRACLNPELRLNQAQLPSRRFSGAPGRNAISSKVAAQPWPVGDWARKPTRTNSSRSPPSAK
jgi:hypothetical protein